MGLAVYYAIDWFSARNYRPKKTTDIDQEKGKTFDDVGGCEKAKEAILEIIDFIKIMLDKSANN